MRSNVFKFASALFVPVLVGIAISEGLSLATLIGACAGALLGGLICAGIIQSRTTDS